MFTQSIVQTETRMTIKSSNPIMSLPWLMSLFPLYWSLSLLNFLSSLITQPFYIAMASSLITCYLQLLFCIRQQAVFECSVFSFAFRTLWKLFCLPQKLSPFHAHHVKPSLTSQSWISYSSPALKLFVVGITLYYKQPVCPCSSNETTSNLRTGTAYSPAQCLLCY